MEWDEGSSVDLEIDVEYDPGGEMRQKAQSFVRLLPGDEPPSGMLDDVYNDPATIRTAAPSGRATLVNDHLNFTVNALHLKRLVEATEGVPAAISDRAGELDDVRDALETLLAVQAVAKLLRPDAPLTAYIKGLYLFCGGVAEVLDDTLSSPQRNPKGLGWRLAEASHFYFDGLTHGVRMDLAKIPCPPRELGASLEELFFAASYLHVQITKLSRSAT
jgi:hypothetical protein